MYSKYALLLCLGMFSENVLCRGVVEMQALGLMEGWDRTDSVVDSNANNLRQKYPANDIIQKRHGFNSKEIELNKKHHERKALQCYRGLLKRKPGAVGRVFFKFKISGANGKLKHLKVSPSHWADKKFKRCVNSALASNRYRSRSQTDLTISYPLDFKISY